MTPSPSFLFVQSRSERGPKTPCNLHPSLSRPRSPPQVLCQGLSWSFGWLVGWLGWLVGWLVFWLESKVKVYVVKRIGHGFSDFETSSKRTCGLNLLYDRQK